MDPSDVVLASNDLCSAPMARVLIPLPDHVYVGKIIWTANGFR